MRFVPNDPARTFLKSLSTALSAGPANRRPDFHRSILFEQAHLVFDFAASWDPYPNARMNGLVHDQTCPIVLLHSQDHRLIDIDIPCIANAKPHSAVRLAQDHTAQRYTQISSGNLQDDRLPHP